jgi:hypothetical protein
LRDFGTRGLGSEEYVVEELVAELGVAILSAILI